MIDLLKEKRQALISHAVTKGLNPNVTMKDSGIEVDWHTAVDIGKRSAEWLRHTTPIDGISCSRAVPYFSVRCHMLIRTKRDRSMTN